MITHKLREGFRTYISLRKWSGQVILILLVAMTACTFSTASTANINPEVNFRILFTDSSRRVYTADPSLVDAITDITDAFPGLFARSVGPISPDMNRILFVSSASGNREICNVGADGSAINLTNNPSADYLPAWSLDGQRLAFVSEREFRLGDTLPTDGSCSQCELYVTELTSGHTNQITQLGKGIGRPFALPGDEWLIASFASDKPQSGGIENIIKVNQRSQGIASLFISQLVSNSAQIASIGIESVTRDGKLIAYTSSREGSHDVFVMAPNGANKRQLATLSDSIFDVNLSPNGHQIIWVTTDATRTTMIQIFDLMETSTTSVSATLLNAWNPTWSPMGSQIAFISTISTSLSSSQEAIYTANNNGTKAAPITKLFSSKGIRLVGWVSTDWVQGVMKRRATAQSEMVTQSSQKTCLSQKP